MSTHKRTAPGRSGTARSSKAGQPSAFFGGKGLMGRKEKQILSMIATQAFDLQQSLGNLEDNETRDAFRHRIVRETTGKSGLRECVHDDFRPLLSQFQLLAGQDEKALATALRSGRITSKGDPNDTREAREKIAHEITTRLAAHIELHDLEWAQLLEIWSNRSRNEWDLSNSPLQAPGSTPLPWPGLDPKWVNKAMNRKIALADNGGPIRPGYLVTIARHKTRRPDLDLGKDLRAGLAERCTVKQLEELLATLVNRINAKEGIEPRRRADLTDDIARNAGQRSRSAKERRSKKTLAPDPAPAAGTTAADQRAADLFGFLQKPRT